MAADKPVYVAQHNHFDLLWCRGWKRTYDFRGKRYRSYSDVEDYVIGIWLENAKDGMAFTEGQSAVFRQYLERNPDRLDEVRELVKSGRIELIACGETVCDTNMPSGETLLRNLFLGQRYFEDTFGVMPTVASLEDAFGHSAQMPQICRGMGCRILLGLSRIRVPGNYWRGLDSSTVLTGWERSFHHAGHCEKIPPCPVCYGMGCKQCHGRGLADAARITDESIWKALNQDYSRRPIRMFEVGGEESIPNRRLPELVDRARRELGLDLKTGTIGALAAHLADAAAKVDDVDLEVSDQVESNCILTGCYVSRILIKQGLRRIENLVNTAERWATVAYLLGAEYPCDELLSAWRNTVFIGFHDAITGTHMDQPYYELLDMIADAEAEAKSILEKSFSFIESKINAKGDKQRLVVYNPDSWERSDPLTVTISNTRGTPKLVSPLGEDIEVLDVLATGMDVTLTIRPATPPLGYTVIEVIPDSKPVDSGVVTTGPDEVENEFYRILVNDKGIESIYDKRTSRKINGGDRYLINELILEEDIGDPWGTMQAPSFEERLGRYTTRVQIRRAANACEVVITGQYRGDDPNVKVLSWRQSLILYKGLDRLDFRTRVDWDTEMRRLRIAFPTSLKTDEAVYSIPYGTLKRSRYEPDYTLDVAVNGDWPAVNWVDVYDEREDYGVALLNTGTPSHKVDAGVILVSLLRSPTDPSWLNETQYYDCPDYDGARDAGVHEFCFSLVPHQGDYKTAGIEKRGREVNNPLICRDVNCSGKGVLGLTHSFLKFDATENVLITAVKKADRDGTVIVRMAETAGIHGEVSLEIDNAGKVAETTDMLELNPNPVPSKLMLLPFEIATVRCGVVSI